MNICSAFSRLARFSGSVAAAALLTVSTVAAAQTAVVPERIIYPGEAITSDMVREVGVTNPDLASGFAATIGEVDGFVTTRTLLPGRTIPVAALREPWAVERGTSVPIVFSGKGFIITSPGTPLQNAAVGDLIRVRNTDTGVIISGTVMNDGSIRVLAQ